MILYIYDATADSFLPLPDMPTEMPFQIHAAIDALQAIEAGHTALAWRPCPTLTSALPCPALPCPALPCLALPCPALPCSALLCPALLWSTGTAKIQRWHDCPLVLELLLPKLCLYPYLTTCMCF